QRAQKALAELRVYADRLEQETIPFSRKLLREADLEAVADGKAAKLFLVHGKLRRRDPRPQAARPAVTPAAAPPPKPALGAIRAAISAEVQQLRAAAKADERIKMERELTELDERLKLSPFKSVLHDEVKRLSDLDVLTKARADCDTTRITKKGGDAAELV